MPVFERFISDLIHGFEGGTWPGSEFNHAAHVAVAAWYITGDDEALDRLRVRIRAYNLSQGNLNSATSGYHETLTCFWYHVISDFIEDLPPGTPRITAVQLAVAEFGSTPSLFRAYYDFDVVKSQTARLEWVPPSEAPRAVRRWLARALSTVPA